MSRSAKELAEHMQGVFILGRRKVMWCLKTLSHPLDQAPKFS